MPCASGVDGTRAKRGNMPRLPDTNGCGRRERRIGYGGDLEVGWKEDEEEEEEEEEKRRLVMMRRKRWRMMVMVMVMVTVRMISLVLIMMMLMMMMGVVKITGTRIAWMDTW